MSSSNTKRPVLNLKGIILGAALASGLAACMTEDCPKISEEHICVSDSPKAIIVYKYRRGEGDYDIMCSVGVRIKEDNNYFRVEDLNCDGMAEVLYDKIGVSVRSPFDEDIWVKVDESYRLLKEKAIKGKDGGKDDSEKGVMYFSVDGF